MSDKLAITGKIIRVLPEESGEGRKGPWRKQEFVVETAGQYPKQVCCVAWGDSIDQFNVSEGDLVTVSIDIQSREYNGRWYTDVKAWRVDREETQELPSPANDEWDADDQGLPF